MFSNIIPPQRIPPSPLNNSRVKAVQDSTEERSRGHEEQNKKGNRQKEERHHPTPSEDASYSAISSSSNSDIRPQRKKPSDTIQDNSDKKNVLDITV